MIMINSKIYLYDSTHNLILRQIVIWKNCTQSGTISFLLSISSLSNFRFWDNAWYNYTATKLLLYKVKAEQVPKINPPRNENVKIVKNHKKKQQQQERKR